MWLDQRPTNRWVDLRGKPIAVIKRASPGCECDRGTRSPVRWFHEPQSVCLPSLGRCKERLVKRVACP